MSQALTAGEQEVDALCAKLERDAKAGGYYLNPDKAFARDLARGLAANEKRYGYQACPCRLAEGTRAADLDIICPCDYRDADVAEYNACYCALYVSKAAAEGKAPVQTIPERRVPTEDRFGQKPVPAAALPSQNFKYPIWRCKVCGYLCARDNPPDVCPICKVTRDRFERFI
ncbi:MAG: ferredoxin-thioredoxin reductase catalytic domain-containing protein [Elusimicrobiales bacterium]|nr:ferredoxin-thioredoxin reductase catalytic domain-containing protein [Elusimicrobiales bacterium]